MIVIGPLHLHGIWIAFLVMLLLGLSLGVTILIVFWWYRWDRQQLSPWEKHRLAVAAVLGIVLSGLYWSFVITGTVDIVPRDLPQALLHGAGSSAGLAGLFVIGWFVTQEDPE